MKTQEGILKIQDEVLEKAYNSLNIELKINIFGDDNITREGIVSGILDFILDHQNIRKNEIEAKYHKKKKGLNSIQQYILDRSMKRELDETNNEYSSIKEFCILFNGVLKNISTANNILNSQKSNFSDFLDFEDLFTKLSISNKNQLFSSFKDNLIKLSNLDFKETENIINKMESIYKTMKENIRFYIPSENRSSSFRDYMQKAIESLKTILISLKEKIESYEFLNSTFIELYEPVPTENGEITKQTV